MGLVSGWLRARLRVRLSQERNFGKGRRLYYPFLWVGRGKVMFPLSRGRTVVMLVLVYRLPPACGNRLHKNRHLLFNRSYHVCSVDR